LRLDACVHGFASNYEGECVTWWLTDAQTRIKRVLDSCSAAALAACAQTRLAAAHLIAAP